MTDWRTAARASEWEKITVRELSQRESSTLIRFLGKKLALAKYGHGLESYWDFVKPDDARTNREYQAAILMEQLRWRSRIAVPDKFPMLEHAVDLAWSTIGIEASRDQDPYEMFFYPCSDGEHLDGCFAWINPDIAKAIIHKRECLEFRIADSNAPEDFSNLEGWLNLYDWRRAMSLWAIFKAEIIPEFSPSWHAVNILFAAVNIDVGNAMLVGNSYKALAGKRHEADTLRGLLTAKAASDGGKARKNVLAPTTNDILSQMERLISDGRPISAAAEAIARRGIGRSGGANRALWYRHRQQKL